MARESRQSIGAEGEDDAREERACAPGSRRAGEEIRGERRRGKRPENDEVRRRHLAEKRAENEMLDSLQRAESVKGEADPDGMENSIGLEGVDPARESRCNPPVVPEIALRVPVRFADVMRPELENRRVGEEAGQRDVGGGQKTSPQGPSPHRGRFLRKYST